MLHRCANSKSNTDLTKLDFAAINHLLHGEAEASSGDPPTEQHICSETRDHRDVVDFLQNTRRVDQKH